MKVFRYIINIFFGGLILYAVIMDFALYETNCENISEGVYKSFFFLGEMFLIGLILSFLFNILNERKIEKQNFLKRTLKLLLTHIFIFILIFLICVINELKYCNKI